MFNDYKHSSSNINPIWVVIVTAYFIGFVIAYNPTVQSLLLRWSQLDEAYGHGFLILLIVVFLCFESKEKLSRLKLEPLLYVSLPLLFLSLLWFVAFYLDIIIIQQLILPLIILSFIALIAGRSAFFILLFPILYIYFAIPIWDYLNSSLLVLTANIVNYLVSMINITVFIEGDTITLPHGQMVIAHGCSGLRYFIICSALSFLSAQQFFTGFKQRVFIITLGMMIGIFINWVRVFALVLIGYYTEMESGLIEDHEFFGWILFVIFYSPMFLLGYFSDIEQGKDEKDMNNDNSRPLLSRIKLAVFLAVIFGFSGPFLAMAMPKVETVPSFDVQSLNLDMPGWKKLDSKVDDFYFFRASKRKPASVLAHQYSNNAALSMIFAVYDYDKNKGDFLPYRVGHYDPDVWQKIDSKSVKVETKRGSKTVRTIEIKNKWNEQKRIVWYWYIVGGNTTSHAHVAKLSELYSLISGRYEAGYVQLSVACEFSCEQRSIELADIISQAYNSTLGALTNTYK